MNQFTCCPLTQDVSSKYALLVTGIDNTVTTFVMRKRFFTEKEKVDMVENTRKIVNGVHTASIIGVSSSVLQPLVIVTDDSVSTA